MSNLLAVKRKVNALIKKSKVTDEGFSYICTIDDFQCVGRKSIIEHLKEKFPDKRIRKDKGIATVAIGDRPALRARCPAANVSYVETIPNTFQEIGISPDVVEGVWGEGVGQPAEGELLEAVA